MIVSVVCVFNDAEVLQRCLIASLRKQDVPYEWIPVDNTQGRFSSASAALNHGGRQATSKTIIFAHQDVVFLEVGSLRKIVDAVDQIGPKLGWAGIAGRNQKGLWRGLLRDRDFISGEPFERFQEVQTLDELLLCTRRDSLELFDESLTGWHAYGVDACCTALLRGKLNYVVASSVWHASNALNTARLREAHEFIYNKHFPKLGPIMTTCGRIPKPHQWKGSYRLSRMLRALRWKIKLSRLGVEPSNKNVFDLSDLMDDLTIESKRVLCKRGNYCFPKLEAIGFRHKTSKPRHVEHVFGNTQCSIREFDTCVLFPDSDLLSFERGDSDAPKNTIQIHDLSNAFPVLKEWKSSFKRHYTAESLDGRMYMVSTNA